MRKIYIFDTSALIYDPCAWKQFADSDIIIPIAVLNELDKLKKQSGEVGRNARVCIKSLDELSNDSDIITGVLIPDLNTVVKIDATYRNTNNPEYAGFGDPDYGDTQILACAYDNLKIYQHNVYFVSNDINLRVKAKSRGLNAISHENDKYHLTELYPGFITIEDEEAGVNLQQEGFIDPLQYGFFHLNPNECILFTDSKGEGIALGRKVSRNKIKFVKKQFPWNINSRNQEQIFAVDLLMDKSVNLVTLIGQAGTGKSLLVLASALELVISKKEYNKFVIYRPIQAVGNEIGYLPGSLEEKLAPWFQAIMDNFEVLFSNKVNGDWRRDLEMFQKKGKIEMEAITYIRGRSIPNSIILVDEAQNLSKEDVKTILTRAGEGTKVILTGDIEQIDNNILDASNNGLTHVIEKFKTSDLAGHITLTKGERSRLASEAAEIL
jgi:PhoH-like ATPase